MLLCHLQQLLHSWCCLCHRHSPRLSPRANLVFNLPTSYRYYESTAVNYSQIQQLWRAGSDGYERISSSWTRYMCIHICVLYAHQNPGTYELCYVLKDLLLHVCVQNPEPTLTTFGRLLKAHTLRGLCVTDSEAVCGKLTKFV